MSLTMEQKLSDEQNQLVATLVREELARRRISRQHLADRARISISTLEKALSGRRPFTLATTVRLEEALGVPLRRREAPMPAPPVPEHNGVAPDELGSYARRGVAWIEGSYLTLRPSFGGGDAIYAYRTEIAWDESCSSLAFRESERLDAAFTQFGSVSVPNQSGHIYLVTNRNGQYRLIIVARPTIAGEMYGILTTLQAGRGSQLTPVAAPIAFVPLRSVSDPQFGRIAEGERCHALYRRYLRRTTDEPFALFLPG
jgi:transcriptional regulator with XRE-family HTH domain